MHHIAAHLAGLAVLFAAFFGAGAAIEYLAPPLKVLRPSVGLVRLTLGIIVWIFVLFLFSALGLLRMTIVSAAAGISILIGCVALWRERLTYLSALRRTWILVMSRPGVAAVTLAVPVLVLGALFFVSLTPYVGWDDNVAHLTLPRIYLESSGFRRVPFNIYSNWPLNIQLLYAFAMLVQDYILAKLLHLAFLALTVVAVYRLASAYSSQLGGGLAAMLLLANPVVLDEARFAYIDLAFAFFFVMAFALAMQHLDERRRMPLLLSGVCCGVVAGTKLMGAVAAPCIGLVVIFSRATSSHPRDLRSVIRDVTLCVALPAFALALPWYVRSYLYTGNPFYPLLYGTFGGPDWNAVVDRQFFDWQQSIGMGRRLVDYVLLPARVALEGGAGYGHFDGRLNPLWSGLVPLSLIIAPSVPIVRRCLGVAGLYFITWALTSQQARFLIPILPLLSVAAAVALTLWLHTFSSRLAIRTPRIAGVVALSAVILVWPARFVLGDGSRAARDMLRRGVLVPGDAKAPVYRFISDQLPPAARLLLLNTNQGFFVDRDYIADSFFEASQMNALILDGTGGAAGISRRLRDRGITHILVARRDWGIPYPRALFELLDDRGLTQLLYTSPDRDYLLFELRGIG